MGKIKKWFCVEREKLKHMSKRSAAEYIWQYYKLWIISCICIVSLLTYTIVRMNTVPSDVTFYLVLNNTHEDAGDGSDLWNGYVEYTGYDTTKGRIRFDAQNYFDFSKNQGEGNTYYSYFCGMVDAGELDAVVMDQENLTAVGKTGRLKDLDRDECSNIKAKYGDRLIYADPLDEEYGSDQVPIGIDISDSILVTKYGMYQDGCALGIGSESTRLEAVEKFLDYILEES